MIATAYCRKSSKQKALTEDDKRQTSIERQEQDARAFILKLPGARVADTVYKEAEGVSGAEFKNRPE